MQPDIVFLLTDDQRFDTIAALGNPHIRTPNMDRLVERGCTFTRAHIPGGTSGAVCCPSRAMLHTGRTLFRITDGGRSVDPEHALLGETLRQGGYHTFGCGKWHNGPASFHRSFADGDEIFHGGMADHWNVPSFRYDPTGQYTAAMPFIDPPQKTNEVRYRPGDHIHAGRHSTDILAETTVDFIENYQGDQPYFCYTAFLAPHDPRSMPAEFLEMYDPDTLPLPPNFLGGHPFDNGEMHIRDEMLAGFPRTPEETRRHLAEYYAMISHLDARIGEIIDAVDRAGRLDRTVFVLAGDNGLALGQHGLFGKQSLYEHSTRVPLILAGPGIPASQRSDALVYLLDVFPTLCELAGTDVPATVDGQSLLPVAAGQQGGRDELYLAYTDLHRGVRTDRYKLIEYVRDGRRTETQLFDLQADPWETTNLAGQSDHAETLANLRAKLLELRDAWQDRETPWGQRYWAAWEGPAR